MISRCFFDVELTARSLTLMSELRWSPSVVWGRVASCCSAGEGADRGGGGREGNTQSPHQAQVPTVPNWPHSRAVLYQVMQCWSSLTLQCSCCIQRIVSCTYFELTGISLCNYHVQLPSMSSTSQEAGNARGNKLILRLPARNIWTKCNAPGGWKTAQILSNKC